MGLIFSLNAENFLNDNTQIDSTKNIYVYALYDLKSICSPFKGIVLIKKGIILHGSGAIKAIKLKVHFDCQPGESGLQA